MPQRYLPEFHGNYLTCQTFLHTNTLFSEIPPPVTFPVPDQNSELAFIPENISSYLPSLYNGDVVGDSESRGLLSPHHDSVAAGDGEIANDIASLAAPAEPVKTTFWEKLVSFKYDIVLLSLLIQLLYGLSILTFDTSYFFLPLFIYVGTKLVWFPTQSKSAIANAFLMLNGISASRVQKIMNVSQWAGVISQDVCVFLFTTISVQSLYITLKNSLNT